MTSHVPQRVTDAMITLCEMSVANVLCSRSLDGSGNYSPLSAFPIPTAIYAPFARHLGSILACMGWCVPVLVLVDESSTPPTTAVIVSLFVGRA